MAKVFSGATEIQIPASLELRYSMQDTSHPTGFSVVSVGTLDTVVSGLASRLDGRRLGNTNVDTAAYYQAEDIAFAGVDYSGAQRRNVFDFSGRTVFTGGSQWVDRVDDDVHQTHAVEITDNALKTTLDLDKDWRDVKYKPNNNSPIDNLGVLDLDSCLHILDSAGVGAAAVSSVQFRDIKRRRNGNYKVKGSMTHGAPGALTTTQFRTELTSDQLKLDVGFATQHGLEYRRRKPSSHTQPVQPTSGSPQRRGWKTTGVALGLVALASLVAGTVGYYSLNPPSRRVETEKASAAREAVARGDPHSAVGFYLEAHRAMPWYERLVSSIPFIDSDYERAIQRIQNERAMAQAPTPVPTKAPPGKAPPTKRAPVAQSPRPTAPTQADASRNVGSFVYLRTRPDNLDVFRYDTQSGDGPGTVATLFNRTDDGSGNRYNPIDAGDVVNLFNGRPQARLYADRDVAVLAERRTGAAVVAQPTQPQVAQGPRPAQAPVVSSGEPFVQVGNLPGGFDLFEHHPTRGASPSSVSDAFDAFDAARMGDRYANTGERNVVRRDGTPLDRVLADRPVYVRARLQGSAPSAQPQAGAATDVGGDLPFRQGDPLAAYQSTIEATIAAYERQHGNVAGDLVLRYNVDAGGLVRDVVVDFDASTGTVHNLGASLARALNAQYLAEVDDSLASQVGMEEPIVRLGTYWTRTLELR